MYLQDCSLSVIPPLRSPSSSASSSEDVTSITLLRFGGGEPRLKPSLLLEVATRLGSSLAFDLRSRVARMCCCDAVASASEGGSVGGDKSFRLSLRSLGRTIFDTRGQHRSVGQNTKLETEDAGNHVNVKTKAA